MFRSYQLCKIFDIPIRLDFSLIVLLFLFIPQFNNPIHGIGAALVLLLSIALHELGHSLTARAFGCRVRDITLMLIGGCATMESLPRKAWQEFLIAIAGPLVSLALGWIGIEMGRSMRSPFLYYSLGWVNLSLGIFNLLPAFPMDGGRILRAFLQQFFMGRRKATWIASRIGRGIAILMAISVVWSILSGRPSDWKLVRLLIAFFIWQSAEQEYRAVAYEEEDAPRHKGPFSWWNARKMPDEPPPDDGKAVISPPPYDRWGGKSRVDIHKENE